MTKSEKYALGVDIGGTNIKIGIVSDRGKLIKSHSVKTQPESGPKKVISNICKGIDEILEKNKLKIQGIGVGCPGVVQIKKGIVENAPNLPGWKNVKLGQILKNKYGYKIHIENDANAAAIGELIFGAGKKFDSFVMVTLGTGVGGGIVFDKKIFRGEFGAAGEVGHISIDINGPKCNCGSTGCIEAYAGNAYLREIVRSELPEHRDSEIWKLIENDLSKVSPKIIQLAAEKNDAYAKFVIERMGRQLGAALASLSNLLDISTFIIGGGVAGFGKPLFDSTRKTIANRVLLPLRQRVLVIPAKLKNEAGIKGASSLVFYNN
ncbi:MAG: ROK family protein [Ignavibacteriota bacterium]|nr:MAG: ROK family protein [Ignavibacteriota bacterium]HOJ05956.1 ROK family protein [Ignavibacteriaceae bacterium]